jgi:hypothetical protein
VVYCSESLLLVPCPPVFPISAKGGEGKRQREYLVILKVDSDNKGTGKRVMCPTLTIDLGTLDGDGT